ncbi:hypothetical protein TV39_01605 [Arthrobacter sp. SPG23]|uniref:hypothetical protein n=1 Tax=Arthrobacter sp. SPG23 TaxID=1610703 RepID=UPI0005BB66E0|nr:hypothetical protein [Arthrobacter sp. SPG23]KIS29099.1 hypothetical protein TV39_01605 [Arthrobacter sp. SPG23]
MAEVARMEAGMAALKVHLVAGYVETAAAIAPPPAFRENTNGAFESGFGSQMARWTSPWAIRNSPAIHCMDASPQLSLALSKQRTEGAA